MRRSAARPNVRLPRLLGACALAAAFVAFSPAGAEEAPLKAETYSAYADPGKTALAVILSEEENVRKFRAEFGLSDAEAGRVLAAVREENEKVATEFAESEEIVAANRSLPDGEIEEKISASDYEASVEGAIAETKETVTALLPGGGEESLRAWVDARWREEVAETSEGGSGRIVESRAGRRLVCDGIFATQYRGYTRYEAALPHRALKFGNRPNVPISRKNRTIKPRVKEVGPWNTRDNWWKTGKERSMWKDLKRCVPEARAAYFKNYNGGRDEFGRKVTNPAGVDLTPRAAKRLGLRKYQNAYVTVRFPWVRR